MKIEIKAMKEECPTIKRGMKSPLFVLWVANTERMAPMEKR